MFKDLKFAIRGLRQNPGFALVAILSLALAIGANSTVYSLAEALVLRPAPVPQPRSIVEVVSYVKGEESAGVASPSGLSFPEYQEFSRQSKSFENLTAFKMVSNGFASQKSDQPRARYGMAATGSFFRTLGVNPQLGRVFGEQEDQSPGRDAVMVISNDMWKRDFASQPDVAGRKVWLGGEEFTVIGVMGEDFTGTDQFFRPAFFIPMMMVPKLDGQADLGTLAKREDRGLTVQGRLRPGVALKAAAAEAAGFFGQLASAYPAINKNITGNAKTAAQIRIEEDPYDAMLVGFMLVLVLLVLLIACANIANLCLSRAAARAREMALRLAIGAGRGRLIRQLLVESLLIAVLGGGLGLVLAQFGVAAFATIEMPSDIPLKLSVKIDPDVLWFTLFATIASVVMFGLVPAVQASKSDLVTALKSTPEGVDKRTRLFGRNTLVVAQVAGSLVLLVVASQVYKGTQYVLKTPMGFRNTGLIMASFNPKMPQYTADQSGRFYRDLLRRAREMRGARSAALGQYPPTSNNQSSARLVVQGYDPGQGTDSVSTLAMTVSDGYFETLGIPVLTGRDFAVTDDEKAPAVLVVNEQFVKKYFPDGRAIGKSVQLDGRDGKKFEIVGVVKQSKYTFAFEPPFEMVYFALPQRPQSAMMLFAQSEGPSAALADPVREAVHSIDSQIPVQSMRTIEEYCEARTTNIINLLSGTFGAMATIGVALAVVGLYGLMSFNVARRVREIGIRMAIGANRPEVIRMIVTQGLRLAGIGVALGLAVSLGLSRVFSQALGVPPFYLPLMGWALVGMMAIAALGALVPALRASKVDPARVMRQE